MISSLEKMKIALQERKNLIDDAGGSAISLFNGFREGDPDWVIECYGSTLVLNYHNRESGNVLSDAQMIADAYLLWLPWIKCVLLKNRYSTEMSIRQGKIIFGENLTEVISEFGINYCIDLRINQDCSFYLDTRYLRTWLHQHSSGKKVLNTFAYTGSLGVAALAGGAQTVVQTDLNRRFLDLARRSTQINLLPPEKMKIIGGDFYRTIGNLKKDQKLFDYVILDPPFFSSTDGGRVDLFKDPDRLINKVKPLVAHYGVLVVVNNALYLSGENFLETLAKLCKDGYMSIEEIIPVPLDVTGYPNTIEAEPPVPTVPFNHATKIVILRVKRKDGRV